MPVHDTSVYARISRQGMWTKERHQCCWLDPVRYGQNRVNIDLTLPEASQDTFSPQLSVSNLSLFRIDKFTGLERTVGHRVSTVLSSTLYLESLNGEKHLLRPGETLHFENTRGEIRTLRLRETMETARDRRAA